MSNTRGIALGFLLMTALSVAVASPMARASFYDVEIEQVIAGVNGDTSVQAVQLRMRQDASNVLGPIRLVLRDSVGGEPIVLFDFTGTTFHSGAGKRILIATANLANHTSSPLAPDYLLTNLIPEDYFAAGTLTLETDVPDDPFWRVSWGGASYNGPGIGQTNNDPDGNFNPPFGGSLPTSSRQALRFKFSEAVDSTNNAIDYELTSGPADFINNDNDVGTITVSSAAGACCHGNDCEHLGELDCQAVSGLFHGNGSTCDVDGCAPPPSNDNCIDARPLHIGLTPFSNLGATTDGAPEPACPFFGVDDPQVGSDVWFKFHSDCNGVANLSLCGSGYDTKLAVYAGANCATGSPIACNDDACGNPNAPYQSMVAFPVSIGQSFLIRIGGYRAAQGSGVVDLSIPGCNVPPPPTPEPPACCNVNQLHNGDWDGDCDLDLLDVAAFQTCVGRHGGGPPGGCINDGCSFMDADTDGRVDATDWHSISPTIHGPGSQLADCNPNAGSCDAWMTGEHLDEPFGGNYYVFGNPEIPPPGYDPQNGNPAIPAGFFGPGSLPFDGVVEFIGQPLDAPNTAGTDTLIEHPPLRFGFGSLPQCDVVPARLWALSLRSIRPIVVTRTIDPADCNGNGIDDIIDIIHGLSVDQNENMVPDDCEWYVGEELSPVKPMDGEIHACKTSENGGTYDATFHFQPMFVFVNKAAADAGAPPDASHVKILDTSVQGMPPLTFQFFNQSFSICPMNSGTYHTPCSIGNFVPESDTNVARGEPPLPPECLHFDGPGESQILCAPVCLANPCTYEKSGDPAGQCLLQSCGVAACGDFPDKLYPGSQCTVANVEPCPPIGFFRIGAGDCQNACASPLGVCVQFYGGLSGATPTCTPTSDMLCP